jgi:hypothetical protein
MTAKFQIGDRVMWSGSWGLEAAKPVTITGNCDQKNGKIVYDLDNGHWCYEYQLTMISEPVTDEAKV